jgi:hypothetical protein
MSFYNRTGIVGLLDEHEHLRLLNRCYLRKDNNACKLLQLNVAIGRIIARLEKQLEDLGFKFPPPRDAPVGVSEDIQASLDGDPDGSPMRIMPTAGLTSNQQTLRDGLESALKLKNALNSIVDSLNKDITELQQKTGK